MDRIYFLENQGGSDSRDNSPLFKLRLELDIPIEETYSDFDLHRPELQDALNTLQHGDRLFIRSFQDLADNANDLLSILLGLSSKEIEIVSIKEPFFNGKDYCCIWNSAISTCNFYRENTRNRAYQSARKNGLVGRPNANVDYALTLYQSGKYTISEIVRLSGVSKSTLYKHIGKLK